MNLVRGSTIVLGAMALALVADWLLIPIRILTPHLGHEPISPLYAVWSPNLDLWLLPALGAMAVAARFGRTQPGRPAALVPWVGCLLLLLVAICQAMVRGGPPALTAPFVIYAGESYTADLPLALAGPAAFLEHYASIMPQLSLHGSTHPPGFTLFLVAVVRTLGPSPLSRALLVILLGAVAVFPLHALARRRHGQRAAALSVALYVGVPSVLIFTATSLDALLPLPAILALDMADRGRTGSSRWVLGAGIMIALVTFLTFSGLALLPICGAILLGRRSAPDDTPRRKREAASPPAEPRTTESRLAESRSVGASLVQCSYLLAGFLLPYLVLRLATGFSMPACFARGRENLAFIEEQMKGRGQHPLRDYVYVTVGNLVAFGIGLGAPVIALLGGAIRRNWSPWGLRRNQRVSAGQRNGLLHGWPNRLLNGWPNRLLNGWPNRLLNGWRRDGLLAGLLVTLAVMDLSFVYLLEVERIWLFLAGPLVVIAGGELARLRPSPGLVSRVMITLLGQALLMEVLLYTFW